MNYLCLVNPYCGISETFVPENLVREITSGIWICECVLNAFNGLNSRLFNDCLEPLCLVSGYRPYAYQQKLFNRKIDFYQLQGLDEATARLEASKIVAPPGHRDRKSVV